MKITSDIRSGFLELVTGPETILPDMSGSPTDFCEDIDAWIKLSTFTNDRFFWILQQILCRNILLCPFDCAEELLTCRHMSQGLFLQISNRLGTMYGEH